jgi:hypothetical protein
MRILSLICTALASMLLTGCALRSDVPLIARSDVLEPSIEGSYQPMRFWPKRLLREMPRAFRGDCLDPGYSIERFDKRNRPTGKREPVVYCSYDPDRKLAFPRVRIERRGDALWWQGPESSGEIRFQRLRQGYYLAQQDSSTAEARSFEYALYRMRSPNPEIFFLHCDERLFANVTAANRAKGSSDCTIDSLDQIRAELDAYVARAEAGNEPVFFLLKRIESPVP